MRTPALPAASPHCGDPRSCSPVGLGSSWPQSRPLTGMCSEAEGAAGDIQAAVEGPRGAFERPYPPPPPVQVPGHFSPQLSLTHVSLPPHDLKDGRLLLSLADG